MLNSPALNGAATLPAVRSITLGQPLRWLARLPRPGGRLVLHTARGGLT
ncbi:MAG: hypothetical protein WCJ76_06920 [Comamonadaceae bacterium]